MGSVLAILGRLWGIIVSFIRRYIAPPSSVLPLSMKACKKSKLPAWRNRNGGDPNMSGVQKEEFLRHPSLRAKQGRHPGKSKSKTNKGHKRHKSSLLAQVNVNLHDWCTQAPPRPPRPPSGPVPSVIVTPCTPTADGFLSAVQEAIYTTPRLSPWDFAIEAIQPSEDSRSDVQPERKLASSARDNNKPGSDPPMNEKDITEWKVVDARDVFAPSKESPEKSFSLSDSLPSITYEHIWHNFKVRSGVSDLLRNSFVWNSGSPTNFPQVDSYVTSTPTKKPQTDNRRRVIKRQAEIDTPSPYNAGTPQTLRLPDEQMDLLPYPDVFDFDVYYGVTSQRASDSIDNPSFSSLIRVSLGYDKNPFGPHASSLYITSSPSPSAPCSSPFDSDDASGYKPPKRVGFVSETPDVSIDHEIKRYRDHYRHPAFSVSPQASSENTSGDSLTNYTPTPNPRALSTFPVPPGSCLRPALPMPPLKDARCVSNRSAIQLPDLSTRAFPCSGGSSRSAPLAPVAEAMTTKRPLTKPPIVVVSHHRFEVSPPESLPDTDASSEALKASLRQTCNIFSKSVSTDNSYSVVAL